MAYERTEESPPKGVGGEFTPDPDISDDSSTSSSSNGTDTDSESGSVIYDEEADTTILPGDTQQTERPEQPEQSEQSERPDLPEHSENLGQPAENSTSHKRTNSRASETETYYSLDSGVPSTTFHSVRNAPTIGGASSYLDTNSNNISSQASSSRFPHKAGGTISSVKIISPEEIFQSNSFGYATDDNKSPISDIHQRYPGMPWPPAFHPSRSMSPYISQESLKKEVAQKQALDSKDNIFSNTRLESNDTKMIININTSSDIDKPLNPGKRMSISNSINSINAINDKNYKLIQKIDQGSQNTQDSVQNRRQTFGLNGDLPEETVNPLSQDLESNFRKSRRPTVGSAVNYYVNLENMQGFVGSAALAFASVPTPKILLRRGRSFIDNEFESIYPHSSAHSTPAAGVTFQREHTPKQIRKQRINALKYLIKEYAKLGLKYVLTLKGFAVTVYFLLVIAFGGMLFLLLCNAAPAMSREWGPDDKVHSPRQIWIEICSQILNGLFCITSLGLFPIRVRDLYLWIRGCYLGDIYCNSKILKIHSNWFWAGFTSNWKLLLVIVLYIMNSVFQVLLCFVMWNYTRFNRPSWTTGTLIAASFSCVIIAGIVMFLEARKIKMYCFQTGHVRQPGLSFNDSQLDNDKTETPTITTTPLPTSSLAVESTP